MQRDQINAQSNVMNWRIINFDCYSCNDIFWNIVVNIQSNVMNQHIINFECYVR